MSFGNSFVWFLLIIMSLRTFIKHLQGNNSLLLPFSSSFSSHFPNLQTRNHSSQPQHQEPYALMKEDPIQICSEIWVKSFSTPPSKAFSNLTGFLSKFDIWVLAYQRSVAHFTGNLPSRNAIHSETLHDLLLLRNAVVRGHFIWGVKTELFLRSPNEKPITEFTSKSTLKKLLGSNRPPFQDRVVQEVLLLILEPIWESRFSSKSHAFRLGRNGHTVIRTIRSNFGGYVWYLRGDFSEVLESVDRSLVMSRLEKVVKDKRVLGLISSALRECGKRGLESSDEDGELRKGVGKKRKKKKKKKKGGERAGKLLDPNEPKPDPYWLRTFFQFAPEEAAKVPQYGHCGILSPLLANVCLNELDHVMEEKIVEFFRPSMLDSIWKDSTADGCHNPAWPEFVPSGGKEKTKKMDYIRYGGHFLIGIRGSREDAVKVREELIAFADSKLGIKFDNSKVEIEHVSRGIMFLDHVICHRVVYPTLHYTGKGGRTVSKKCVGTLLSVTASLPQCIRRFRRLDLLKGDKDPEPLPCTPMLYSSQAHTNSQMNKFLETMADWYRYADNRKKAVGFCAYVIRSSLGKLYAARYKLKSRAKVYKIASRSLSHPLRGKGNKMTSVYSDAMKLGLAETIDSLQFSHMSLIPSCDYTPFPRVWIPEHEQLLFEYIKLQDPRFFSELLRLIKTQGLNLSQNEMSQIIWDFKTLGVHCFNIEPEKHSYFLSGRNHILANWDRNL